uniref:Uncharacterized protein n=1 Tax=Trypanosoma congolense (strain IL3000) TaxID=1068625 RepID=G0UU39_TRYCI|nr:conserved hypothetical protein [Trypanosoma congolense IL3000]
MFAWLKSSPQAAALAAGGSSLALEQRLARVTADDIAGVTPADVQLLKQRIAPDDLQCATRVMLENNRYSEVMASASAASLHAASRGIDAACRNSLAAVAQRNLLALYNIFPYITENHINQLHALFSDDV